MSKNPDSIRIVSRYYPDFGTLRKNLGHSQIFRPQNFSKCKIVSGYYPDTIWIFGPDGQYHYNIPLPCSLYWTTYIAHINYRRGAKQSVQGIPHTLHLK